jgi:MFS family permease
MFATLSTAWVVPGLVGPAIASVVGEHLTWRAVFLGLLPLIAIAAAITIPSLRSVPEADPVESEREHEIARASGRRLPNAVRVAAGAGILLAGLTFAEPIRVGGVVIPFALTVIVLVLAGLGLAVPAFRALTPSGTLVATAGLPATILLRGVLTFMFFAPDAYVPLALETWRDAGTLTGGIALTAATLAWTAGAWVQARTVGRLGIPTTVAAGWLLAIIGIGLFTLALAPIVPVVFAIAAWAVTGLGMGIAYSPITLAVLRDAPPETQGSATSALQLSDVLGTALGTGFSGAVVAAGARMGATIGASLAVAFVLAIVAGVGGLALTRRMDVRSTAVAAVGQREAA